MTRRSRATSPFGFRILPKIFPLGTFFSYNNAGFTLLGRLIEVATGTANNAAMGNLLLGPLGLDDTLLDHAAVLRRPYADGHIALPINGRPAVAVETQLWVPRSVDPAGGIADGWRLVCARGGRNAGLLACRRHARSAHRLLRYPGAAVRPDRADQLPCRMLAATAALDAALAQFPALTPLVGKLGLTHALLAPAGAPTVTLSADDLAAYAGRYADPGQVFTFARSGDGLTVTAELLTQPGSWQPAIQPPPAPAAPVTFLAKDMALANGARIPFVRDASGRVRWVSSGLRRVPRVAGD